MNESLENTLTTWHTEPQESARRLIDHYGEPDEYSATQLIWHNTTDGWKRTILVDEVVPHNFPAPHNDYLAQSIDYKVPLDMHSTLAAYDGSLTVERTKGEMSARCGGTSMNFVAVNLAHEIIIGERTIDDARVEYARLYRLHQNGETHPYTEGFVFDLPTSDTKDSDVAIV